MNSQLSHSTPTLKDRLGGQNVSSIVDYYITNVESLSFTSLDTSSSPLSSISIYSDLSLGSDHKLMSLTFNYSSPKPVAVEPSSSSPGRFWKLPGLQEIDVQNLYTQCFETLSKPLPN